MMNSYQNSNLWKGDGIELFAGPSDLALGGSLQFSDRQLIISAAAVNGTNYWQWFNTGHQPAIAMNVQPTADGQGYVLDAAIPWTSLNIEPARAGSSCSTRDSTTARTASTGRANGSGTARAKTISTAACGGWRSLRLSGALTGSGQFASRVSGAAGVNDKPSRVRVNNAGSFSFSTTPGRLDISQLAERGE